MSDEIRLKKGEGEMEEIDLDALQATDVADHVQDRGFTLALHMRSRAKTGGFTGTRAVNITSAKITDMDLTLAAGYLRSWEIGLPPMDPPEDGETEPVTDEEFIAWKVRQWGLEETAAEAAQEIETWRSECHAALEMVEAELSRRGRDPLPSAMNESIDMTKVIAFSPTRPVPTSQQLHRMQERGVTPHIVRRDDGALLFIGATNAAGENVDNDCVPIGGTRR